MNKSFVTVLMFSIIASCNNEPPVFKADTSRLVDMPDTTKHSSITLYNKGGGKLIIEDFVVSCGCTIPLLTKGASINAADSLIVPLTFQMDSSKKKKVVEITLKCNSVPRLNSIKFFL